MELSNKSAIVTGGGQGIGKGLALALAKAGANVVIHYHVAADKADTTANEIRKLGRRAITIQSDFSQANAPEAFLNTAISQLGSIDILVNCAAIYHRGPLLNLSPELFTKMQQMNVEVPLRLIQGLAHHLIERKAPGSIINISSISGLRPAIGSCAHSCAKAALNMLTASAALELAPYQIRVNGIAPGVTETESNEPYMKQDPKAWKEMIETIPLKRGGYPSDYAGLVVLLASDASSWLTGVTITCDGGTTISQ